MFYVLKTTQSAVHTQLRRRNPQLMTNINVLVGLTQMDFQWDWKRKPKATMERVELGNKKQENTAAHIWSSGTLVKYKKKYFALLLLTKIWGFFVLIPGQAFQKKFLTLMQFLLWQFWEEKNILIKCNNILKCRNICGTTLPALNEPTSIVRGRCCCAVTFGEIVLIPRSNF